MLKPLPPSLRGDVAAATGGSKSSTSALHYYYTLIIALVFASCNRGLQVIASVLLPPAAKAAFPPQRGGLKMRQVHFLYG